MKRLETKTGYIIIGTAREIMRLYNNLETREIANPVFSAAPKFIMKKYYGLVLTYYDIQNMRYYRQPIMQVVSSDTALAIIHDL